MSIMLFLSKQPALVAFGVVLAASLVPHYAFAAAGGGGLPWDTALQTLETDLTGPTAFVMAILAFVCAGFALVFGGELSHFVRGICYVVLVSSMLAGAPAVAAALGIAGASIG